jgi:hypothetical protein
MGNLLVSNGLVDKMEPDVDMFGASVIVVIDREAERGLVIATVSSATGAGAGPNRVRQNQMHSLAAGVAATYSD